MKESVISAIVKRDLCIGCGVCTAICPEKSLEMCFNEFGEYNPIQKNPCLTECGLCLKVCPFSDGNDNEDIISKQYYSHIADIQHSFETGYFLANYVGYAHSTRTTAASGGLATWLLQSLLEKKIVDFIVSVTPNDDPERLFNFSIISDPKTVVSASGSVYYPVEISEILKKIQNQPGKYAIIGLPCLIKAIRLAQKNNKKLKERIIILIGLTCGQLKSKQFTEYTTSLAGLANPAIAVKYREKSPEHLANNYHYSFLSSNGEKRRLFWTDGIDTAWIDRWFTPNACNYCDDVFAECADITLMDAWLPEFISDFRGTSLILVRSALILQVIEDGIQSHNLSLKPISIEQIIISQMGVVHFKKKQLGYRLYYGNRNNIRLPKKRVEPTKYWLHPFQKMDIEMKEVLRTASKKNWTPNVRDFNLEKFKKSMDPFIQQQKKTEFYNKIIYAPY